MFDSFIQTTSDGHITLSTVGIRILALLGLIVVIILAATFLTRKKEKTSITTKQLVFCSIAMALAIVTSYMQLYTFPFGGSVTLLSMFFICFIGYLYGARVSIPVAFAYGILQLIIKPYIYHPIQVLFDYPLAFGALGFSGFFSTSKRGLVKGYIIGILGRWLFSSVSGYVFFAEYAWPGWNPIPYTLAYNGAYIFTEAAITIPILLIPPLYHALSKVKQMAKE